MTFRNSTIRPDLQHSARDLMMFPEVVGRRTHCAYYSVPHRLRHGHFVRHTLAFYDLDHFARAVVEGRVYEDRP